MHFPEARSSDSDGPGNGSRRSAAGRSMSALGLVWPAPWQELSDVLQHWSGAVTCPACWWGRYGGWTWCSARIGSQTKTRTLEVVRSHGGLGLRRDVR